MSTGLPTSVAPFLWEYKESNPCRWGEATSRQRASIHRFQHICLLEPNDATDEVNVTMSVLSLLTLMSS